MKSIFYLKFAIDSLLSPVEWSYLNITHWCQRC